MISGCATYRAGVALPDTDTPVSARAALQVGHGRTAWIGLSDPAEAEAERVSQVLGLNARDSRTVEEPTTRASLDVHEGTLHLTAGVAQYDPQRDLVVIGGLSMLIREDLVVTVTRHAPAGLRDLRRRLEGQEGTIAMGGPGILLAHLHEVIDGYATVLGDLRDDVEALEREVFGEVPSANASQRIYLLKREALDFKQATAALIDPLDDLADGLVPLVAAIPSTEWAALRDRLVRLVDRAQAVGDLLTGILSAYQTDVALRQNEDMRKISAWVAIAAVPTLLAGIYGMNFESMPELGYQYGYPILLVVMGITSMVLYRVFRSRHWL